MRDRRPPAAVVGWSPAVVLRVAAAAIAELEHHVGGALRPAIATLAARIGAAVRPRVFCVAAELEYQAELEYLERSARQPAGRARPAAVGGELEALADL